MAAQKGRDILIKVEDSPGAGTYTTIAGMRAKQLSFKNPATDLTDSDSPNQWAERATGYGVKDFTAGGNGVFKQGAPYKRVVNAALQSTTLNYQIVVPGFGSFTGPMVTEGFDLSGDYQSDLSFSATFMAAGELTFSASF